MAGQARRVGIFTAACVLVSNAVGSGIFTTSGFMAHDLGAPWLILALWAAGGALALAGAMSYAELGAAMPQVGGEYVYLRRAFGPVWGFLSGWTSFTVGFGAAISAAAVAFAELLSRLLPELAWLANPVPAALALVWALSAVHALGIERGGPFQQAITVVKIGGIGLLLLLAVVLGDGSIAHLSETAPEVSPSVGAAAVSLVFVLYSFSGWNAASYIAGEIHDPERSLPRALIGGTLFVTALYLAVNLTYFYALPASALGTPPLLPVAEKAAEALFGPVAASTVLVVLCVSIAGATSSMIWAAPRVYQAMAQDGVAPASLAHTSDAGAPVRSTLLQAAWCSLLVLSGTFEQLVVYSGVALAVFGALAVSCVIVLRWREPDLARPYRVSPYPWVPLAYIAASLWIAVYAGMERPREALLSVATIAAGLPLYAWLRARNDSRISAP